MSGAAASNVKSAVRKVKYVTMYTNDCKTKTMPTRENRRQNKAFAVSVAGIFHAGIISVIHKTACKFAFLPPLSCASLDKTLRVFFVFACLLTCLHKLPPTKPPPLSSSPLSLVFKMSSPSTDMFNVVAALVRKHSINILELSSVVGAESFEISPLQQVLSDLVEKQILTGDIPVDSVDTLDVDFVDFHEDDDGLFGDGNEDWSEEPATRRYRYNDFVKISVSFCFVYITQSNNFIYRSGSESSDTGLVRRTLTIGNSPVIFLFVLFENF